MKKYIVIWLIVAILINMLLYQNMSTANPAGWSADINLTPDDDKDSKEPSIGIYEDNIHVVWGDSRHYPVTNRAEIYYRNSTDGGKTWNPEVRLTFSDNTKLFPRINVNGNNIHLIWIDDRDSSGHQKIYYKNSTDGGDTWSIDRRISPLGTDTNGMNGDIAVNGNNIHVVYPSTLKLFYINSTDNGITWSEPQQLTASNRDSAHPAIAVNKSNVHIVWRDHYDKNGQGTAGAIFYLNSTDNGLTWSEDFNLTPMNLDASYSDIVTNENAIHVVFSEQVSGIWETHYRRSEDGGISWSEDIQLTNWGRDHHDSSIDIYDDNVSVVWWTNWKKEPDGNGEIYYINSTDNGYSWSESLRLTYDPERAGQADLSRNKCKVYIVWNDVRDGNAEIYYKYFPYYPPPINLTIDIWGTNLTLNWTTPQIALSPVDYYLIYRVTDPEAFTFSDSEIVYNSSGTGNDLLTTWNDTTALLDEANNYYYVVRAVYENGEIDTNENIVGKYVIPLNSGWNLISIPLSQNDTRISEVLKSIDDNYNIVQWYDAKSGIWRSSSSSLTGINRTMGLWIHMKNTCNLSVAGALPKSTDIALYEGWNLVGYPSLKTRNLNDALSGITWRAVQQYDAFDANDPWKHNSTKKPNNLNDLEEMQSGRGYWVYITINDTWTRTRTSEDNKVVIWRVGGSDEEIVNDQPIYDPTIKNPIEIEDDDLRKDIVKNDKPIIRDQENNLAISLIPLIILIAFIFTEIGLFHRKRR
jgi:hypothetical protein